MSIANEKSVHLRTYDGRGVRDLFVYAAPGPQRERWMEALRAGDVLSANGGPKVVPPREAIKTVTPQPGVPILMPTPIDAKKGQVFHVTPELAAKWLERNTRNRKLYDAVVARYASDMTAGRWMVGPDAIAFDTNGAVINGQHRLWAVLESGVTVPMLVVFDLQPDVVNVLDDHRVRTLADVAHIRRPGAAISTKHTSTARAMQQAFISVTAVDVRSATHRLTRQDQLDFLDRHYAAIDFAWRECLHSTNIRGITVSAVLAGIARAYYSQSKERLRQFGAVLQTGQVTVPAEDNAAVVLRNWLQRQERLSARTQHETIYRKAERSLQAFCKREKLQTLYEAAGELFLLPEEKTGVYQTARSAGRKKAR